MDTHKWTIEYTPGSSFQEEHVLNILGTMLEAVKKHTQDTHKKNLIEITYEPPTTPTKQTEGSRKEE
jgi:hypothetical protein